MGYIEGKVDGPQVAGRGVPDDAAFYTNLDKHVGDFHSHSWCTLDELYRVILAYSNHGIEPEYRALLASMRSLAANGNKVRMVFWFEYQRLAALEAMVLEFPHLPPGDCFAIGPNTGDPIKDLVMCPGCVAMKAAFEALGATKGTNP